MKIRDIADIQIGYQFRSKVVPVKVGTHRVIQMKDINNEHQLDASNLIQVNLKRTLERYKVKKGNILFLARGHRNFAFPIKDDVTDTIASGYFYILKIKSDNILPEYLAWYINQLPAQRYISGRAKRGSHMPMVPKSAFQELPIDIPPIEIQRKLVELDALARKEESLLERLRKRRKDLITAACLQAIKTNRNRGTGK